MRFAAIIVSLAASVTASAVLPVPSTPPLPVGEVRWQGVVVPGKAEVEVWGASFEDIEAQIREQYNPNFSIYTEEMQDSPGSW
ncbi:hypothetical protein CH63R_13472 [Colletotrichum higginsianum IMI 349063]|uniref:Uncharacterized protein n=2 Tax=Colletotrichum destructivum species complex TaxID=2707350 RepID=A0A1B7XR63_COLHI|nr:hypothetical protein CH63R_13472 [Colletotrichum higginsianum IMI 349063]OBR02246.1 hypothetical protein CH63R_13472 [Colletotrichum higginsianum IMI 349063]